MLLCGFAGSVQGTFGPKSGWPVSTNGGSRFSPLFLLGPAGDRFLLHNQTAPGSVGIPPMAPWLVTRNVTGAIRAGWPVTSQGLPLNPPAVVQDEQGRAVRFFTGGGRVNGLDIQGQVLPGWPQPEPVSPFIASPSLGDLDGDGVLEVIAANNDGDIFVWRQDGTLVPGWPQRIPMPLNGGARLIRSPPAAADLDGDGSPEVVALSLNALMVAYDRFGRLRSGWPWDIGGGISGRNNGTVTEFAIVPLGDGTSGVAMGTQASPSRMFLIRHDGLDQPGWPRTLGSFRVNGIAAGDLDADGRPELVAGEETAGIFALSLDGTVLPGWPVNTNVTGFETQPLIVDFSGDGQPDVITLLDDASRWFLFGWHGDGRPMFATFGSNQKAEQGPTFGELDGDGLIDMAIAARNPGSIFAPGRVHVFGSDIPVEPASMHWPTYAHDYQRTSTWIPPTQLFGGRGAALPPQVDPVTPPGMITLRLRVPDEAPVEAGLAVTALGGFTIPPIPGQVLAQRRLVAPAPFATLASIPIDLEHSEGVGMDPIAEAPVAAPGTDASPTPAMKPVVVQSSFNLIAQVSGPELMEAFEAVRREQPELLLNDDELRDWLDTGVLPTIPSGEARPLWLTLESPRVGVRKLKAHVALNIVVGLNGGN